MQLLSTAKIGQKMRQFLLSDPHDGDMRIQTLAEAAMGCATNVSCSATRRRQTMHDLCFGTDCTLLTLEFSLISTALNAQSLLYQSVVGIVPVPRPFVFSHTLRMSGHTNGFNFDIPFHNTPLRGTHAHTLS